MVALERTNLLLLTPQNIFNLHDTKKERLDIPMGVRMSRTVLQECCNSQQGDDDVLARVSHPSLRLKSSPESYVWDHLWNSAVI